jgi:hypothetical protein
MDDPLANLCLVESTTEVGSILSSVGRCMANRSVATQQERI